MTCSDYTYVYTLANPALLAHIIIITTILCANAGARAVGRRLRRSQNRQPQHQLDFVCSVPGRGGGYNVL